ncbi:MAG: PAS domain-containing protein [Rubrivirga sp.]
MDTRPVPPSSIPFPALRVDRNGAVVEANEEARDIFGDSLIGSSVTDLFDEHDELPVALDELAESLGRGRTLRVPTATGQTRLLARFQSDGDGGLLVLVRLSSPDTESMDLDLLAEAVNAADNSIVIADLLADDQPLVYVNRGFERMTGYSRAEAVGRNCRFLQFDEGTRDDDQDGHIAEIREAVEAERLLGGVVIKNYKKDGTLFYNDLYLTPVTDESGRATHMVGVQNDVTERVEAARIQQRQHDQLKSVIESSVVPIGILVEDEAGFSHFLQNEAAHALGLSLEGDPLSDLEDRPARSWSAAIEAVCEEGSPVRFDIVSNGATYEVLLSPIQEPGPQRLFYVASNVTEGRAAADDLLQLSNYQLQRIAQDIHDGVGQSLVGASMLAAALSRDLEDDALAGDATRVKDLVTRSLGMLRSFSLGLDPVDLDRISIAEAFGRLTAEAEQVLGVDTETEDRTFETEINDGVKLDFYRITQEAITNAVRHGSADRVSIRLSLTENDLVLEVEDNGQGIGDRSKTGGMGLRTMRARARRHDGQFALEVAPGGGALVRVVVPRSAALDTGRLQVSRSDGSSRHTKEPESVF